ncbi:MAG: lipid-A-disaccharide synthase [Paramuribaculum sp.]|nr:lipid-A-disaccharide synthase [Paramuribaculum sp.]
MIRLWPNALSKSLKSLTDKAKIHRYFISAGEPSGDLHASELIRHIKKLDPSAEFYFLGGDLMREASESEPLIHYRDMAFMGFSEVLRNLKKIFGNLKTAKQALHNVMPDALILVDYPSFNLKLAKEAHRLSIPVYWYISPKVWAWKEYRVRDIRKYVRRVLCILPFEVEFYRKHGVEVSYVGNPSLEEVDRKLGNCPSKEKFCNSNGILAGKPLLALVPGSRRGEIKNNLPIMTAVAARFPELTPVVAGAPGIDDAFYLSFTDWKVIKNQTLDLMHLSDAALVTSGTATLECALAGTPQVVCYRANGSKLSYNIMKRILKVPFVSLPNLIAGYEVIPEMLVHQCTVDGVSEELQRILPGNKGRERQLEGYHTIRDRLGEHGAAKRAAELIMNDLTD